MKFKLLILISILWAVSILEINAQPTEQRIKIIVAPDHTDWIYKLGEKVKFTVSVLQDGNPIKGVTISYEVGPEMMEPAKKETIILSKGIHVIEGGTLKDAGFLRCTVVAQVEGNEYRGLATAGFEPLTIKPTVETPADFVQFWQKAKSELAKIPIDARMTLLPEWCTENINVYQVNLQNFRAGARLYGILCVPKKEGKYPAVLRVPGAGVSSFTGDVALAEKAVITFQIGIHGIPVNMSGNVYDNLDAGALSQYEFYNLDDRDRYYYKRVYMGCIRANDFLVSLPQYDGVNLGVSGGSQGGALSIVTAALDARVKYLAAFYPALCDVTGYLHGRAGGWPGMFDKYNIAFNNKKDKIETCGYYDVVNFARLLKVPGMYSWGFNDETCPPTSMYAAYNVISASKSLHLVPETGHYTYPEQRDLLRNWLIEKLKGN